MSRIKALKKSGRYRASNSPFTLRLKIVTLLLVLVIISVLAGISTGFFSRLYASVENTVYRTSAAYGLVAKDILIEGNVRISSTDVMEAIDLMPGESLLKFNLQDSYNNLLQLPWVKKVHIERHWPHKIKIKIEEREPLALWQYKKQIYLIDREGTPIPVPQPETYNDLPLVMGPGAPEAANQLVQDLQRYPELGKEILAAVRIGNRRWNLKLKSGITLMLPEENQQQALDSFVILNKTHNLMSKAKTKIDWRIKNKFTIS